MSNSFTLQDYIQPDWSAQPQHKYYFEVIKDGTVLGKLDIKQKSFNLIGRLEDLCDIPIDNQTVSRKHAILQAKADDHCLYLYDLASAHGTFVNKQKLPMRTFKKLAPFDNVKFGVSSRIFVLRCPAYEQLLDDEQAEKDNKFSEILQNQHRQLSKDELKEKYLDMLENDPNFAANQAPRKLMGKQQEVEDEYEGIDWGISDEREVYSYKNDNEFPIEPDILRRLNLDSTQLNKLADYEEQLRKYQEVEGELNEITGREKRQFGLEEKLQAKKDKLERKFVEAVEALEKAQDWLRVNIFGENVDRVQKNIIKVREKENDTFGDDEYLDRTLQNKDPKKAEVLNAALSTEDYWKLEKELNDSLKKLEELKVKMAEILNGNPEPAENKEQEDQLDTFMKDNNMSLDNENIQICKREEELLITKIQLLKSKFQNIMGQDQLNKMTDRQLKKSKIKTLKDQYKEKSLEESLMQTKKKMELNYNIENILNRLEAINEQEEEINELDPSIFNVYKGKEKDVEEEVFSEEDEEIYINKKRNLQEYNPQKFEKPLGKHVGLETLSKKTPIPDEEEAIDLTRTFK